MIRPTQMRRHSLPVALALAAACWPAASFAQSAATPAPAPVPASTPAPLPAADPAPAPSPMGGTIRLSDEERNRILDNNTAESAAAARGELPGSTGIGRGIHGEVGAMIGTNGTRGIYGTAAIPLGDNAGAVISFETSRTGYRRYPR